MNIDSHFDWMNEPCTCGDYLSHMDGGDANCQYCSGATLLRAKFQSLVDVNESMETVLAKIGNRFGVKPGDVDALFAEIEAATSVPRRRT